MSALGPNWVVLCLIVLCAATKGFAFQTRSIDGSGNSRTNPIRGATGAHFSRQLPHLTSYSDGISAMVDEPNARDIVS